MATQTGQLARCEKCGAEFSRKMIGRPCTECGGSVIDPRRGPAEAERSLAERLWWLAGDQGRTQKSLVDIQRLLAEDAACKGAALEELMAAAEVAEGFIADELAVRRACFFPEPSRNEAVILAETEQALQLIRDALAKCREVLK